ACLEAPPAVDAGEDASLREPAAEAAPTSPAAPESVRGPEPVQPGARPPGCACQHTGARAVSPFGLLVAPAAGVLRGCRPRVSDRRSGSRTPRAPGPRAPRRARAPAPAGGGA